jgi:hypothetical protein
MFCRGWSDWNCRDRLTVTLGAAAPDAKIDPLTFLE